MSEPMKKANKELAEMVCPMCDHSYGYDYDNDEDNENQRTVACCPCGVKLVSKGSVRPTGPVPPPCPGQLPRILGHHPELCGKDCTECVSKKPAPATFDGEGNSSVSAAPSLADIALSKGQRPLDPDSSDPLSKWTCKHGMCILPNPTGRHNAYTWNGVSHEYGNGRYRVCKACYVEKHPSDPEEKKRLTLSGSF